jgi:UDP-3-O-[3-hydroxymyristoyl] glucosamine N-acyltransferase
MPVASEQEGGVTPLAIVAALGGHWRGTRGDRHLSRIAPLDTADAHSVSFLANARYSAQLAQTQAGCVIAAAEVAQAHPALDFIVTPEPYLYFARLTRWWASRTEQTPTAGIHPSAVVDGSAQVHPSASIGPLACVEAGARVEAGVILGPQVHVGRQAVVGANSRLVARVSLGSGCSVGERCLIHPGAVIGADGFGFAPTGGDKPCWEKIAQLGAVRIGNDVEIGANTCIDRGALDDTVIEDGVKLDNLIQIGHNVQVGAHTAMAGCAGVAGSARIGAHCTVGGGAVILGHLSLADGVHVSAASVVTRSLHQAGVYSGVFPLDENAAWEKNAATLKSLHTLRARVRALEQRSEQSLMVQKGARAQAIEPPVPPEPLKPPDPR